VVASSAVDNLLSVPVLAFVVALVATLAGVDLKLPSGLSAVLSTYLLFAIGLKGGRGLSSADLADVWQPLIASIVLGVITPLVAFAAFRAVARLPLVDAAAIAAHYGSVSAVTFTVVLSFLESSGEPAENFLAGLLAILEIIGIVVALAVANLRSSEGENASWGEALSEVLRGRSIALLVAGLTIGLLAGADRISPTDPLFVGLFQGVLALFLLEMGTIAAHRIRDLGDGGWWLPVLAVVVPLVNGSLGAVAGSLAGLSTGGTTVMATLAASASYIAAPAAVRIALPQARPGLYITASLGVTFPFNVVAGVPIYYAIARGLT
jgi:uncharacterized protein